ncbi:MAG: hypothetical protein P4L44_16410 [Oryzomonas sp.]|uniref:hypothetical protein n=1 Tax=Oryzomonas sp. TaxID=2855186 RepID=UPI0028496A0A|nr:hypothetical protein [Oryzomonas sp.]MDR3581546.1 hypothetical protein [Oryzomonas sp.]
MRKNGIIVLLFMTLTAVPCRADTSPKEDGRDIGQGLKKFGKETGKTFKEGGKEFSQGFKKLGKESGQTTKKAGRSMGEWFRDMGHSIKRFFSGRSDATK